MIQRLPRIPQIQAVLLYIVPTAYALSALLFFGVGIALKIRARTHPDDRQYSPLLTETANPVFRSFNAGKEEDGFNSSFA
eukprot:m.10609 g.10609  ORF g.10609 m.10609 type:complete len:80 (+) comp5594_c0_seq1:220-459(+)